MKSLFLSTLLVLTSLCTIANPFICSTNDCGNGATLISSAPTDGTAFFVVWFVTSATPPVGATISQNVTTTSGSANFGATTITVFGAPANNQYRISTRATISANQNKPTVSNIDVTLQYYTAGSFFSPAGTASFIISTATPLPVEFISVNASSNEESVILNWSTAMEINNDIFVVERSEDGELWEEIGVVPGAGNSMSILEYSFADVSPLSNAKSFYRIKQIDFDGKYDFSEVVTAQVSLTENIVKVSPNPATSDYVTISSTNEIYSVEVRDITGKLILTEYNATTQKLNISSLNNGIYYIRVNDQTIKLIN